MVLEVVLVVLEVAPVILWVVLVVLEMVLEALDAVLVVLLVVVVMPWSGFGAVRQLQPLDPALLDALRRDVAPPHLERRAGRPGPRL